MIEDADVDAGKGIQRPQGIQRKRIQGSKYRIAYNDAMLMMIQGKGFKGKGFKKHH